MRIALIDPSLFTLPYDFALTEGLASLDHDVTLYGRKLEADEHNAGAIAIDPHFYRVAGGRLGRTLPRPLQLGLKGLDHIVSMRRLLRRFRQRRPDVIHFQWLPLPVIDHRLLPAFGKLAPLVLTVHDTNPFNGAPSSGLQSAGMVKCFAQFDRLIVHTTQGRSRLQNLGIDPVRIAIVPHGLLAPVPAALPDDPFDGEVTLLLFGRVKPYKGLDVLIEAFALLPKTIQAQCRIRVVGKPFMDLAPLLARARALGVMDRLSLETAFIPDTAIGGLFCGSTIVMFPYRDIEASGVLFLALSYGRPVIASALGSFKDILEDGKHGLLVPPGDAAALAVAIKTLLSDRSLAARCGRSAEILARSIPSWEEIGGRTTVVYGTARFD